MLLILVRLLNKALQSILKENISCELNFSVTCRDCLQGSLTKGLKMQLLYEISAPYSDSPCLLLADGTGKCVNLRHKGIHIARKLSMEETFKMNNNWMMQNCALCHRVAFPKLGRVNQFYLL